MGMFPRRRAFSRLTARSAALPGHSRRALLLTAMALAATGGATPRPGVPDAPGADPYETLRRRWLGIALGTGYDATAQPYASR
ncbi:hypothetical protein, partial [Streptomyces sp. NRRL S-481]|uniref:hypothetical protein n=1 Tax=Streptomyces sp. NRRL S-481 TaxID=1463911 RepID=UPI0004C72558